MRKESNVLQTIQRLAAYQSRLVLIFLLLSLVSSKPWSYGLVVGSLVAWLATWSQNFVFRRLPEQADARIFFATMVVAEILKWLVVAVLMIVLSTTLKESALGVVIGFMTAYLSYFLLLLKG